MTVVFIELLTYDVLHDESDSRPIITFDRGYPSGELINHIVQNDGLFLIRCSFATFNNVLACPQGHCETFITYNKQKIKLRVLRFFLNSDVEEILITNLFDENLSINDFKELYFLIQQSLLLYYNDYIFFSVGLVKICKIVFDYFLLCNFQYTKLMTLPEPQVHQIPIAHHGLALTNHQFRVGLST